MVGEKWMEIEEEGNFVDWRERGKKRGAMQEKSFYDSDIYHVTIALSCIHSFTAACTKNYIYI